MQAEKLRTWCIRQASSPTTRVSMPSRPRTTSTPINGMGHVLCLNSLLYWLQLRAVRLLPQRRLLCRSSSSTHKLSVDCRGNSSKASLVKCDKEIFPLNYLSQQRQESNMTIVTKPILAAKDEKVMDTNHHTKAIIRIHFRPFSLTSRGHPTSPSQFRLTHPPWFRLRLIPMQRMPSTRKTTSAFITKSEGSNVSFSPFLPSLASLVDFVSSEL